MAVATQLTERIEGYYKKLCNYKKADDKYISLESAYGLDWISLHSRDNSVKAAARVNSWSSSNGKFEVRASLLTIGDQWVLLRRDDTSKDVKVSIDRLDKVNQSTVSRIRSDVDRLSTAVALIDSGKRPIGPCAADLSDDELVELIAAQGPLIPKREVEILRDMLRDQQVFIAACKKAKLATDTPQARALLILEASSNATFIKDVRVLNETAKEVGMTHNFFDKRKGMNARSDDAIVTAILFDLVEEPGKLPGKWGDSFRREWKQWTDMAKQLAP